MINMEVSDNLFWVDDIWAAVALELMDHPCKQMRVNPHNDRRVQWGFQPDCREDFNLGYRGKSFEASIMDVRSVYRQLVSQAKNFTGTQAPIRAFKST